MDFETSHGCPMLWAAIAQNYGPFSLQDLPYEGAVWFVVYRSGQPQSLRPVSTD